VPAADDLSVQDYIAGAHLQFSGVQLVPVRQLRMPGGHLTMSEDDAVVQPVSIGNLAKEIARQRKADPHREEHKLAGKNAAPSGAYPKA